MRVMEPAIDITKTEPFDILLISQHMNVIDADQLTGNNGESMEMYLRFASY